MSNCNGLRLDAFLTQVAPPLRGLARLRAHSENNAASPAVRRLMSSGTKTRRGAQSRLRSPGHDPSSATVLAEIELHEFVLARAGGICDRVLRILAPRVEDRL